MKIKQNLIILFLLATVIPGFSQTLELEYESMMDRFLAEEFTQLEFKDVSFAWRDLIDSTGYPDVPYDSVAKKVEYGFISTFEGVARDIILNRVSEWAAVTFGSTDGLLTHQGSNSRLILNGSIEIFFPDMFLVWKNSWRGYVETEQLNSSYCYFTMVFTIQDGRMKSQIVNISYEYTDHVSDRTISRTLDSCFPVSKNEKDEWKATITLVKETRESLKAMIGLLEDYIRDYENDYAW